MKQKMVVRVSVNCEKCRKKVMQVAAVADGVMSVALEGDYEDKLVVIGDGVDAACLVATLRKKACHATVESLEVVKPQVKVDDKSKEDKGKGKGNGKGGGDCECQIEQPHQHHYHHCPCFCYQWQPPLEMCRVVCDSYGPTTPCIIM